jgi:hypothetical protein
MSPDRDLHQHSLASSKTGRGQHQDRLNSTPEWPLLAEPIPRNTLASAQFAAGTEGSTALTRLKSCWASTGGRKTSTAALWLFLGLLSLLLVKIGEG